MNIGSLEVMLGANTAGLSRAAVNMKRFETQVLGSNAKMQGSFQALGSQMMLTGTMMTQYLTVPIALLGGAAVTAFAKFETQLAKIVALTGTSQSQVNTWSKSFLNMSKEFGQAPKDIADAMYFIASPALKASTSMEILRASTKGAAIGLGETKVVADALVSVINTYGESNISAAGALDIMVTSVKNGKWEASDLARVIGKVLPVAQALGVGFGDVAGSLATMTLTGKSASEAATQLTRLFATLIQAPPKAEKVLSSLGLSFESLRHTLREGGVVALVEQLNKSIGGGKLEGLQNTKTYADNVSLIGDVFTNLRALLPILDMLGPNMKNWTAALDANTKAAGAADTAWGIVSSTVNTRFKQAIEGMNVSLISVGAVLKESVIGLLQSLTKIVENLANWFTSLSSSTQQNIISWLGFLAALGPVLLLLGGVMGAVRMLGVALLAVVPIVQAAWASLAANPLGALATGLALIIALGNLWYQSTLKGSIVQQALNEVNTTALRNTVAQKQELESLMHLANNENATLKMKQDAIARINSISPEYLGFINTETVRTKEATDAIGAYMTKLTQKATLQAAINNKIALEQARLSDLSSGQDKKLPAWKGAGLQAMGALSIFNSGANLIQQAENAQSEANKKEYDTTMSFYTKLIDDLNVKINGATIPPLLPSAENAKKTQNTYTAAYESLDKQLKALMDLMEQASGKELDKLAKKYAALSKIKTIQDDLIQQAIKMAENRPMQSLGSDTARKALLSMGDALANGNNPALKGIGNDPFADLTGQGLAERKGGIQDMIKYTQDYVRGLQDVADKKAILGKTYNMELEQNKVEITYFEDILKYRRDNGIAIGDTIEKLKSLHEVQKTLESDIPVLEAWRNLFRDVASLMSTIGQYMGEGFQQVFKVITDIVSGVGEFIRIFKDVVKLTELIGTASKDKETASITANTIAIGANSVAQGVNIGSTTAMVVANQALSAAASQLAISEAVAAAAWIPFPGNIAAMGTSVAAAIAALATAIPVAGAAAVGLAQGGTVPSGFPNDSFPAMLTSGETVIPLTKMATMFGNGAGTAINVTVEGVTRGTDIHYIVKEVERKLKNAN